MGQRSLSGQGSPYDVTNLCTPTGEVQATIRTQALKVGEIWTGTVCTKSLWFGHKKCKLSSQSGSWGKRRCWGCYHWLYAYDSLAVCGMAKKRCDLHPFPPSLMWLSLLSFQVMSCLGGQVPGLAKPWCVPMPSSSLPACAWSSESKGLRLREERNY